MGYDFRRPGLPEVRILGFLLKSLDLGNEPVLIARGERASWDGRGAWAIVGGFSRWLVGMQPVLRCRPRVFLLRACF